MNTKNAQFVFFPERRDYEPPLITKGKKSFRFGIFPLLRMNMNADVSGIPRLTKCCISVCWLECFCKGSLAYLIFVIFFITGTIFGSIFLHAKARKSRQNGFRKNSVIRHKTDFTTTKQSKFWISSHLSCGDM